MVFPSRLRPLSPGEAAGEVDDCFVTVVAVGDGAGDDPPEGDCGCVYVGELELGDRSRSVEPSRVEPTVRCCSIGVCVTGVPAEDIHHEVL